MCGCCCGCLNLDAARHLQSLQALGKSPRLFLAEVAADHRGSSIEEAFKGGLIHSQVGMEVRFEGLVLAQG
jgi:hypothetical protein